MFSPLFRSPESGGTKIFVEWHLKLNIVVGLSQIRSSHRLSDETRSTYLFIHQLTLDQGEVETDQPIPTYHVTYISAQDVSPAATKTAIAGRHFDPSYRPASVHLSTRHL